MRAKDIPLEVLLERALMVRARVLAADPDAPRFRVCEANHLAQLDAVVSWLESVPGCEWVDEYLERPRHRLAEES
jgi:hypothetical protein